MEDKSSKMEIQSSQLRMEKISATDANVPAVTTSLLTGHRLMVRTAGDEKDENCTEPCNYKKKLGDL
ncbi:hypothetical protein RUM43_004870 [Polyplax serrata]|uniref:Uncharacterized protein n=1 Tax=Polyplax serrata TaxID=468196 RepID=A0AAN8SBC3_POLSC